jgi:hypothetical protein
MSTGFAAHRYALSLLRFGSPLFKFHSIYEFLSVKLQAPEKVYTSTDDEVFSCQGFRRKSGLSDGRTRNECSMRKRHVA